jgi:hypothetical protein
LGTDVPHVANAEEKTVAALRERKWPDAELQDIFGGTARRLMV